MEQIMAVLTGEKTYGERLCAYANFKRNMPFTAVSFDSITAYANFARKHKVGVLLTDGHIGKDCRYFREPDSPVEEMVIGLFDETDEESVFNYSEGPGIDTYTLIPKYQSAEKIMRSVMNCCSTIGCHLAGQREGRASNIAGIYAPDGRVEKTLYALIMAKVASLEKKTLFISFEEFSGVSRLSSENYTASLSDAMLAHKAGGLNGEKLYSMVYTYSGIDYIPPIQYAGDMKGMTGEDCQALLLSIMEQGLYEVLIVDLPLSFSLSEELMDICREVFIPELDDELSAAKTDEFMDYLEFSKKLKLRSKICRFKLPKLIPLKLTSSYIDTLLYSEMGDMARKHAEFIR